jgi:hypothetical protein
MGSHLPAKNECPHEGWGVAVVVVAGEEDLVLEIAVVDNVIADPKVVAMAALVATTEADVVVVKAAPAVAALGEALAVAIHHEVIAGAVQAKGHVMGAVLHDSSFQWAFVMPILKVK